MKYARLHSIEIFKTKMTVVYIMLNDLTDYIELLQKKYAETSVNPRFNAGDVIRLS